MEPEERAFYEGAYINEPTKEEKIQAEQEEKYQQILEQIEKEKAKLERYK